MNTTQPIVATPELGTIAEWLNAIRRGLDRLAPVADLAVRLWVAKAFWQSGLVKVQSWESTVSLFTYEYRVPLLSPEIAAYLGAFTELFFPVLLMVGLAGRFAAGVLFIFNIVAVLSYPALMGAGIEQHQVWGILLLVTLLHGPGRISIDHWIAKKWLRG